MTTPSPILVTGASGFVAQHTVIRLLQSGYAVRATLRDFAHEANIRGIVAKFADAHDNLEFVKADLVDDVGWDEAMRGCEYAIHVASPFPLFEPKNENELIVPARQGTLRVLRAAHQARVKRVVIVSSVAAVSAGHEDENRTFDEHDWSILERNIGAYARSKTLAEHAAWDFIGGAENTNKMELVTVAPSLILGPALNAKFCTSAEVIRTFMLGQVPGVAWMKMGIVDARDVAAALLLAMTTPEAAGNRFLCVAESTWIKDVVAILRKKYAGRGYKIHTFHFHAFFVRILALFDKKIARFAQIFALDWDYQLSNEKAKRTLKWNPRPAEEAILAMAESLIELKLL